MTKPPLVGVVVVCELIFSGLSVKFLFFAMYIKSLKPKIETTKIKKKK